MVEPDIERSVTRPADRDLGQIVRAWLAWFGWGRIATVVVSVAVVIGGAWLLLRAPTPPVEQGLPMTSSESTVPTTAPAGAADPPSSTTALVVVHVAGAVRSPGVFTLPNGARLHEAIDAAGGGADQADLDRLNLAEVLVDGHRVYVPQIGVEPPVPVISPTGANVVSGPVDLNRADATLLQTLPGIGPATAAAIVEDRASNGPFASIEELERVPGIGPAKLAALRDLVTV